MHKPLPTIDARRVRRITGRLPAAFRAGLGYGRTTRPVVALRVSGRDCDGYDMDSITYAEPAEVEAYIEDSERYADGPMHYTALTERELAQWLESREDRERHSMRCGWDDDRF